MKNATDVVGSYLGKHWLKAVIAEDDDYKAASAVDKLKLEQAAWEELRAYILLDGAHSLKYKSAKLNLMRDASLKDERYPKTLTAMMEHLGNLPWDQAWHDDKKKKRQERERAQRNNDSDPQIQLAQAGQSGQGGRGPLICHCCGETGHISRKCPKKDQIPYPQWYRNRAIQAFEANTEGAASTSTNQPSDNQSTASDRRSETDDNQGRRSQGPFQLQCMQVTETRNEVSFATNLSKSARKAEKRSDTTKPWSHLRDVMIIDSASTEHTACNTDLCTDVRRSEHPINMSTNAGETRLDLEATWPTIGTPRLNPTGIANVVSIARLILDGFRVQMDSEIEHCINVFYKGESEPVKFMLTEDGLFAYKPCPNYLKQIAESKGQIPPQSGESKPKTGRAIHFEDDDEQTQATEPETDYESDVAEPETDFQGTQPTTVETVKENMKHYTPRQIAQAKQARELMLNLGCTPDTLKRVIKQRMIDNNPVLMEHIEIADKIWGKDIPTLKGKDTRRKPSPVIDDHVEIPREIFEQHPNLILEIDIMYVNKLPMLTGIDRTVRYRNFEALRCRRASEIGRALATFIRDYNRAGFKIARIDCDNEFHPLFDVLEDKWRILLNTANPGDHAPAAERNNRTIKEGLRTLLHGLPFKYFPRLLLR